MLSLAAQVCAVLLVNGTNYPNGNEIFKARFGETVGCNLSLEHPGTRFKFTTNRKGLEQGFFINLELSVSRKMSVLSPVYFEIEFDNYFGITQIDKTMWRLPNLAGKNKTIFKSRDYFCSKPFNGEKSDETSFYIDGHINSPDDTGFNATVYFNQDSVISQMNTSESVNISSFAPAIYEINLSNFTELDGADYVQLDIFSPNTDQCAAVIIKNAVCPLVANNLTGALSYATFTTNATILIQLNQSRTRVLLQIEVLPDSLCRSVRNEAEVEKLIVFGFPRGIHETDYIIALSLPLGIMIFSCALLVVSLKMLPESCCQIKFRPFRVDGIEDNANEGLLDNNNSEEQMHCTSSACTRIEDSLANENEGEQSESESSEDNDTLLCLILVKKSNTSKHVRLLNINAPGISPGQLLLFLQLFLNVGWKVLQTHFSLQKSSTKDLCHHNFRCLRPLLGLMAFNHVFANVWYVFFGVIFILIAYRNRNNSTITVYLAMGIAMTVSGISLSMHQLCPTVASLQFDTCVIYLTAIWCIIALYPPRNEAEGIGTGLITSGNLQLLIGKIIYICTNGTEWFWVLMTMMHIIITAVLSLHIQAKYDKIWWDLDYETPRKIKAYFSSIYTPFRNLKWPLLFNNFINLVVAGIVWLVCHYQFSLISASAACQIHLYSHISLTALFWLLLKVFNKGKLAWSLYIASVLLAMPVLPHKRTTSLDVSAATSRRLNEDCIMFDFYDFDDIIDFFRALKLFLFFMTLYVLACLLEENQDTVRDETRRMSMNPNQCVQET